MLCCIHNFTYKKPKEVPAKADISKQEGLIAGYEQLKLDKGSNEDIFFMDSVHPSINTKLSHGWIKKGKDKIIASTASRSSLNISGAINLDRMEVIKQRYETINTANIINFLGLLRKNHPKSDKLHIILDRAGYHTSKELQDFVRSSPWLQLHFLPPYSPNLNPIERLWKVMNEEVRNNRHFSSLQELTMTIKNFFSQTIPNIKEKLRSRINDNFQTLDLCSKMKLPE